MPRSGGTYSPPSGVPVSTGSVASSTVFNNLVDDIGDEITNSIPRDGTAAPTADIPMGTRKLTNVGNGSSRNQYPSIGQIQDASVLTLGSVSGTNTITGALTPAVTAYSAGMTVVFEPANTNTDAATISINGVGAVAIVKDIGIALTGGELIANVPALLIYDGTQFVLANPGTHVPGKYKTAITTRASTTSLADDPHLALPLQVGVWEYKLYVQWMSENVTTGALKFAVNYSGTRTGHQASILSNASGTLTGSVAGASLETGVAVTGVAPNTDYFVQVEGILIVTTTGNLRFQWAQVNSNVNATWVIAGRLTAKRFG